MTPPTNLDGSRVQDVTIDGTSVNSVTMDGDEVFGAIPDSEVYLHDDWGDNKLQSRDGSKTTTHNDVGGVYRPGWTIDTGSPSASNDRLQIDDGERIYNDINIDLSSQLTLEIADVDLSAMGSDGTDYLTVYFWTEQTSNLNIGIYQQSYLVLFRGNNGITIRKMDDTGTLTTIVSGTWSSSDSNFTATRASNGTFELFVEGSSQGTGSDTEFNSPSKAAVTTRNNGDASINELKWS